MGRVQLVGIDVGGTFIDYVALQPERAIRVHKALHRPGALAESILEGLAQVAPEGAREVIHGTTVATNAIIERQGARVALVTTRGFADVIEIGRQDRPDLYSLESMRPDPLVGPELRFEVDERVTAAGEVVTALSDEDVERLVVAVGVQRPEAAAVCLLFSFLHPEHEERVTEALRLAGVPFVTSSTEVMPEYREYERTTTTVGNAYVSPILAGYLGEVSGSLESNFRVARFEVMQSNGGVLSAAEAAQNGVRMLLSGPAGGVAGAFELARQHSVERIITFDMGGTSTDVALCDGYIPTTVERSVAGVPVRLPMVDIETVGAGGGSLARLDSGGALRVGPESAGADPGPACFGRGTLPTVTDAQAVCGLLDVDSFLGGRMELDLGRARAAIGSLAAAMGVDELTAAEGTLQLANVTIEQAIRRISIERGFDPREFTLVAFGGAGPLHACAVAHGLGITRVMVPPFPGVMSALGMAMADAVRDFSLSVLGGDGSPGRAWASLEAQAERALPNSEATRTVDCRYRGQGYELEIAAEPAAGLSDRFHDAHLRRFGFEDRAREVELVTARLRARRRRLMPEWLPPAIEAAPEPRQTRVRWGGASFDTPVVHRSQLPLGERVRGPALVVQADSAVFVAPDWVAATAVDHTLLIEWEG